MRILNTVIQCNPNALSWWIFGICVTLGMAFIIIALCRLWVPGASIGGILLLLAMTFITFSCLTESDAFCDKQTQYQVIIDNMAELPDILEHYEIVSQDGLILTLEGIS